MIWEDIPSLKVFVFPPPLYTHSKMRMGSKWLKIGKRRVKDNRMVKKRSHIRKRTHISMVRLTLQEKQFLVSKAKNCCVSVPHLMRSTSLGYTLKSTIDQKAILDLLSINADLARLGNLLKMYISHKSNKSSVKSDTIHDLINQIRATQSCIKSKVRNLWQSLNDPTATPYQLPLSKHSQIIFLIPRTMVKS